MTGLVRWIVRLASAADRRMNASGTMPEVVADAFHRHDRAASPPLWPGEAPAAGQQVKVQITLARPLRCASAPLETTEWLAMGGSVEAVESPGRVRVSLCASTDRAPAAFDGDWTGTLELRPELEHPWVLTELRPR